MIDIALKAAMAAGQLLRDGFGHLSHAQIDLKGQGDYVTELDLKSENEIIRIIRDIYPSHAICAEESGGLLDRNDYTWIIDPLDGTANYVHGIPIFAVSIAVMKAGELVAAVVYNPITGELFRAEKGAGAWRGDNRISVSSNTEHAKAMLSTGFPWRSKEFLDGYIPVFRQLLEQTSGMRRLGAAAVDLAYTAAGVFDGFFEMSLKPWDIAAGILLVLEAGGVITDFNGGSDYWESGNIVAGTPVVHPAVLKVVRSYLGDID